MNTTYYKIGILVFGFVLLAGAIWFVLFREPTPPETLQEQVSLEEILDDLSSDSEVGIIETPTQEVPIKVNLKPVTVQERWEDLLGNQARTFVSRYGTYTNQSDFANIKSLKPQMTLRLSRYVDTYIDDIKTKYPYTKGYYGITTRAFTQDFGNYTSQNSKVNVIIETQRIETIGDTTRTFNQDVTVSMVYSGGVWLIDGVFWE